MGRRARIRYSESQRAGMWERWRKGDTLHQIAALFDLPILKLIYQFSSRAQRHRPATQRESKEDTRLRVAG